MRILVINPNTTASMTEKIALAARSVSPPDVDITARNPATGPAAIQGREDGLAALPGMMTEVARGRDERFDAIVLACFDDTGLAEARMASGVPTIGIGEASFHAAMMLGGRFSVVTTLSVSVPVIEENLETYGIASQCASVRASEVPVLDLEKPGSEARNRISAEIHRACKEDHPAALVLGCAGMADLAAELSEEHQLPVIDGVAAAIGMASALVRTLRQ
ncbi:MAG: aspartate/glutamate racemase family protein [Alphaproteobacteria bacterium]|nr:aspartate/glutamate racemase family protein [Alphaproteobacteria bacterium]